MNTGGVSEMESLISQVQQLGSKADFWSSVVNWLIFATALVGILYFGVTIRSTVVSRKLRNAQDALSKAKDGKLTLDLKDKDQKIADAQREAADAGARAAEANKESAKANESAAKANESAGRANERANKLSVKANELAVNAKNLELQLESEKIARLKIEERFTPRVITDESAKQLMEYLLPLKGQKVSVISGNPDPETYLLFDRIVAVLRDCGMEVDNSIAIGPSLDPPGISFFVGDSRVGDAEILADSFKHIGLEKFPFPGQKSPNPTDLKVIVGRKPTNP